MESNARKEENKKVQAEIHMRQAAFPLMRFA